MPIYRKTVSYAVNIRAATSEGADQLAISLENDHFVKMALEVAVEEISTLGARAREARASRYPLPDISR